jgi:hypothetical protein
MRRIGSMMSPAVHVRLLGLLLPAVPEENSIVRGSRANRRPNRPDRPSGNPVRLRVGTCSWVALKSPPRGEFAWGTT